MNAEAGGVADVHAVRFSSHRRTLTETDVVTFVNVAGVHEPFLIDMEYVREKMGGTHRGRFIPGPMVMSVGMGLVAPLITGVIEQLAQRTALGPAGGMTGVSFRLLEAVYPGDTLRVEGDARVRGQTGRGYTLVDIRHRVFNQHERMVADFTETALFLPAGG